MTDSSPPSVDGFQGSNRGLASGILTFVAVLVIAALVYTLLDPAIGDIVTMSSSQTSNQGATDVINLRQQIWGAMLFYALFLAMLAVIARSVYESRTGV